MIPPAAPTRRGRGARLAAAAAAAGRAAAAAGVARSKIADRAAAGTGGCADRRRPTGVTGIGPRRAGDRRADPDPDRQSTAAGSRPTRPAQAGPSPGPGGRAGAPGRGRRRAGRSRRLRLDGRERRAGHRADAGGRCGLGGSDRSGGAATGGARTEAARATADQAGRGCRPEPRASGDRGCAGPATRRAPVVSPFTGFGDGAVEFYDGLLVDNTKAYWTDQREIYESHVRAPDAGAAGRPGGRVRPGQDLPPVPGRAVLQGQDARTRRTAGRPPVRSTCRSERTG